MIGVPKFLILRFAPGAAGNMLAGFLQCSPEVAHWDPTQQLQKPNNSWAHYFQQVFTSDLSRWVYNEPSAQLQWGTRKIFSAKYPRGNDISLKTFLELEQSQCTLYYHQQKKSNRYLPIFWHKQIMPEYFQNSRSLIIKIDNSSLRWFDHAVFYKHYNIISTCRNRVRVELLENRPEIVPDQFRTQVDFMKEWPSFREFVREKIYQNPYRAQYRLPESMTSWNIPTMTVSLSALLDNKQIYQEYCNICHFFQITQSLCEKELTSLHAYWKNLHAF